jgi:hypothetical protein
MIKTILLWLFWTIIVLLILFWFISGGPGKVVQAAHNLTNPFGSTGTSTVQLPWQVSIPQGADISNLTGTGDNSIDQSAQDDQTNQAANEQQAQNFGNPSPYASQIRMSAEGATASDPNAEYVEIDNSSGENTPVDITGWSLQSALTNVRAYIPRGASLFEMGAVNSENDIELAPGGSVIVVSGISPVGISFRENECTGYLAELQTYTPDLQQECPSPSDTFQETPANLSVYGDACYNYIQSLASCHFPQTVPSSLSLSCRSYIINTFTYNGCVQMHQNDPSFPLDSWRIYLGASRELWRNTHDIIRLLDAQGRIVASVTY